MNYVPNTIYFLSKPISQKCLGSIPFTFDVSFSLLFIFQGKSIFLESRLVNSENVFDSKHGCVDHFAILSLSQSCVVSATISSINSRLRSESTPRDISQPIPHRRNFFKVTIIRTLRFLKRFILTRARGMGEKEREREREREAEKKEKGKEETRIHIVEIVMEFLCRRLSICAKWRGIAKLLG